MRKFFLVLLSLMLLVGSVHASSLSIDTEAMLQDLLIEHRVFLTGDTDDYSEVVVIFYGQDTHKIYQLNDEILYTKGKYSVDALKAFDPDSAFPGFSSMPFASMSVEETDKAVSVLFSFSKLNDPQNFRLALQNGIFTGSFPEDYAKIEDVVGSIDGRELSMQEYGQVGLHFDIK